MSAKSTGIIWDMKISVPWRMVLLSMVDHADHNGEHMRASQAFIAWKTGYSSRSVARIIQELLCAGLLIQTDETIGVANEYRFDLTVAKMKPVFRGRKPKKTADTLDKMAGVKRTAHAKMAGVSNGTLDKMAEVGATPAILAGTTHDILAIDSISTIVGDLVGVGGVDLSFAQTLIERGLNPTTATEIAAKGYDPATILQSLDNMLADGRAEHRDKQKVLGNFRNRMKIAPPPIGHPYPRQQSASNGASITATRPNVPETTVAPAEMLRQVRARNESPS